MSCVLLCSRLGSPTEMGVVRAATGETTDTVTGNVASGCTVRQWLHSSEGDRTIEAACSQLSTQNVSPLFIWKAGNTS